MRQKSIRPVIGNWAGPESFFNREQELTRLVTRIRAGASVSLSAPRRVGKTSLLRAAERTLKDEMTCVFVDLESCDSAESAIREIAEKAREHRALQSRVGDWMRAIGANLQVKASAYGGEASFGLQELLRVDWQSRGAELIATLTANQQDLVLFLDELPVLVATLLGAPSAASGRSQADLFLSWLRRMIQEHRQLRVVLTGSIGLAPMVARAGLSTTLNAYEPMRIEPWRADVAVAALRALSKYSELSMSVDVAGRMIELLGIGVPFHVQLFHDALVQDAALRESRTVERADVERVWSTRMINAPSSDLPHWEQRLRKAMAPAEYKAARSVLTAAAGLEPLPVAEALRALGAVEEPEELLRLILEVLEHDGYLARGAGGWFFPNRLLRAWWAYTHMTRSLE